MIYACPVHVLVDASGGRDTSPNMVEGDVVCTVYNWTPAACTQMAWEAARILDDRDPCRHTHGQAKPVRWSIDCDVCETKLTTPEQFPGEDPDLEGVRTSVVCGSCCDRQHNERYPRDVADTDRSLGVTQSYWAGESR